MYLCVNNKCMNIYLLGFAPQNRWIIITLFSRDLLRLNVGRNSLNEIPSQALGPLKNLNQLDLSFNKIKDIKEDTFTGKYICNGFENDVHGILGMKKLDTLNLNHNKIEALLDNHFEWMPKVTSLSLDYYKISDIAPEAFNGLEGKACLNTPDCLEKCQNCFRTTAVPVPGCE